MRYFVIWFGNIETDPLDNGIEAYTSWDDAILFAERMKNKGYDVRIFEGKELNEVWQA